MPHKARTPCWFPGCGETVARPGYCRNHRAVRMARIRRGHTWSKYGGAWRGIRRVVLEEEPLCRKCGVPSEEADHILPLRRGGTHRRENLQGLCGRCHKRKTAAENDFARSMK